MSFVFNKKVLTPNWNPAYGIQNKSILNKTPMLNAIPVTNSYIFFRNGAMKSIPKDNIIDKEIKKIFEEDRKNFMSETSLQNVVSFGPGTNRPLAFTERKFSDLYYNDYGFYLNWGSFLFGALTPLAVSMVFGIPIDNLMGLIVCITISIMIMNAIAPGFFGGGAIRIPRSGISRMYYYEQVAKANNRKMIGQLINRFFPLADTKERKIIYKKMTNLCSDKEFQKTIGTISDGLLSKAECMAGVGYSSSIWRNVQENKIISYINNLKTNSTKKYEKLNELRIPNIDDFEEGEEDFLNALEEVGLSNKILFSDKRTSVYIDFTDWIPSKITRSGIGTGFLGTFSFFDGNLTGVGNRTYRNIYKNPANTKSIFGPYICRSRSNWFYYPKINITTSTFSTGLLPITSGTRASYLGGINLFGGIVVGNTISGFNFLELLLFVLSLSFPILVGTGGMFGSAKELGPVLTSPPITFPRKKQ
jgi:hypothetical protein